MYYEQAVMHHAVQSCGHHFRPREERVVSNAWSLRPTRDKLYSQLAFPEGRFQKRAFAVISPLRQILLASPRTSSLQIKMSEQMPDDPYRLFIAKRLQQCLLKTGNGECF